MPQTIKDAYLEARKINVITVDWKNVAQSEYHTARLSLMRVGEEISEFIQKMVKNVGLKLAKTGIVGFCLGAHVAGIASRMVGAKIDHITGKPIFTSFN